MTKFSSPKLSSKSDVAVTMRRRIKACQGEVKRFKNETS